MPYFADPVIYFPAEVVYHNAIRKQSVKITAKGVPAMNPKLRIMTIRLLNRMAEYPVYAASVGITGNTVKNRPDQSERSK